MKLERELEVAKRLAVQAGREAAALRAAHTVTHKAGGDPVTNADIAANEIILEGLSQAFPGEAILSEETPSDPKRLTAGRVWIIDPIDGTKEYITGTGDWAVQIGLAEAGLSVLGVVNQVEKKRLFSGFSGGGAFVEEPDSGKNRRKLQTSRERDPFHMRMTASRWHRSKKFAALQALLKPVDVISAGGIGVKMGLLALAEVDLYLHPSRGCSEWDSCAPNIVLREAGGEVTDLFGAPLRYNGETPLHQAGIACSNGAVHGQILALIEETVRGFGFAPVT